MDLYCTNTVRGLVPNYDRDYDEKRKLKIGVVYKVRVTKARNYEFHKKYFALIDCAWECLPENLVDMFKNSKEHFRKTLEIASGHCEPIFSITMNEFVDVPKSIAFDKMNETEFQELYESVKDVLFLTFLRDISEEDFMKNLVNF